MYARQSLDRQSLLLFYCFDAVLMTGSESVNLRFSVTSFRILGDKFNNELVSLYTDLTVLV